MARVSSLKVKQITVSPMVIENGIAKTARRNALVILKTANQ